MTNEDPEVKWLREVYQPGAKQLTARAVISGMVIGMLMCLSNLYVVLKTGWSVGVTITACILAWTFFHALKTIKLQQGELTTLENNAMGSVASAAGYMTGGGNMAALPALLLLTGVRPDTVPMIAWFAVIAMLGVFAAIPIKRSLINVEQLPFPTGTATAETLKVLHSTGGEGKEKARLLALAGVAGGIVAFFRESTAKWMPFRIPGHVELPFQIAGYDAKKWTIALEPSLLTIAIGALMSFRTGWSLLLGALVLYGFIAPEMVAMGAIAEVGYRPIVQWSLWTGAAILVSSGLLSFAFQWKMVGKSFTALGNIFNKKAQDDDPMRDVECPPSWFPIGFIVLGPIVVFLMYWMFDIPIWAGVIALPLAVIMGFVAARVTGETDVTPTKALGPVTQLIYGGLLPGAITPNVMSANVTGGVGLHAADLLTDLKSGFLLGANPRQQFYAQLFGCVAGAAIIVPIFNLLITDPAMIGSEEWPAPGALVWAGVSKVLSAGMDALHTTARWGALIGTIIGIALTLAEKFLPKNVKTFVPSASGVGIAFTIPASTSIMMFFGALIAEIMRRKMKQRGEELVVPISSGCLAGESLMGIFITMLKAGGVMAK